MSAKHIAVTFLAPLLAIACAASPTPGQTRVVVIGTAHQPNHFFTSESLYQLLRAQRPDVVLLEGDPIFFDENGLREEIHKSLEGEAVLKYQRATGIRPQPFDITGRQQFFKETDYFRNEAALSARLSTLYSKGRLSPEAKALVETIEAFSSLGAGLTNDRPEVFNSVAADIAMEHKQHYVFEGLMRVIELTPEMKAFGAFWRKASDFWIRRNDAMVQNILKHVTSNPGKRIVVLCGFEHRTYLRRELAKHEKAYGFLLHEFWAQDAQQGVAAAAAEHRRWTPE